MVPATLISPGEVVQLREAWGAEGSRVGFVPTMGALHLGHLSLVEAAKARADRVIVSIFVNPIQFGPSEDFARYPRTLKEDLELLGSLDVDAVFLPNAASMYPPGFQTYVYNKGMSAYLCGAHRPGHFEGVLTVVLKLFNIVRPHAAIFGKKDYQQWRLIERMAKDLELSTEVVGAEILREVDGLAMSSRNRYLSDVERSLATRLHQGLQAAKQKFATGVKDTQALREAFLDLVHDIKGIDLEYAELRRQIDLEPVAEQLEEPAVMLVAARVGATRLIDNMELG